MGEFIGIGDALTVTLFSIVMVFLVLIVISIFISMLKNLDKKKKEEVLAPSDKGNFDKIKEKTIKEQEAVETTNDEEIIAVISAALAASMGLDLPQINIKKIRRINTSSSAWSDAGRQEQIYSKL